MSLCQFSPARRTPIGRPFSVALDTTTISGLPGTIHRSPKMLNSISPNRRVKATCCGGVICWSRRSEEHTSELQSRSDLPSFPTRRSSDLRAARHAPPFAEDVELDLTKPAGEGNLLRRCDLLVA